MNYYELHPGGDVRRRRPGLPTEGFGLSRHRLGSPERCTGHRRLRGTRLQDFADGRDSADLGMTRWTTVEIFGFFWFNDCNAWRDLVRDI